MGMAIGVTYPTTSGLQNGRPLARLKAEQQYFEVDYTGAIATDQVLFQERQDGTNWVTLTTVTIDSTGDGTIKDTIGDFLLNGSMIRVKAQNAAGNTTYQIINFSTLARKTKLKKDFSVQVDDLFVHSSKSLVKHKKERIFLPALRDTVTLIEAEDNSILTETTLSGTTDFSTNNLSSLPNSLQMNLRTHFATSYINGVNLKSFPSGTNSDFSGAGGTVTATNTPLFVGDGKVYNFAATGSDAGLLNGEKFLKVLKANIGKHTYNSEAISIGSQAPAYSTYIGFKNTYNAIATAKTTELF